MTRSPRLTARIATLWACAVTVPATLVAQKPIAASAAVAPTPPMGFNTWNKFACDVSDSLIRGVADAIVSSGMKDAGYRYVVIDDCWQVSRDASGTIVADPQRFPNGIKPLADYVHARGLKFGIYTDAGTQTCQGRPGTKDHEEIDARTYAAWGVDYVKEDWCHAEGLDPRVQYAKFRDALRATGRPIVLSICEWGRDHPWDWGPHTGNLWRTTGDIDDSWQSMTMIAQASERHTASAGPGHWNDPDMLEIGNGGMTDAEYRAHFSLWAEMAAPLIAGNDLRTMSPATHEILTNAEVIAVDQDPAGVQGHIVMDRGYGGQVWSRPLRDGSRAVVMLNLRADSVGITADWRDLGLHGPATVRDLWAHADLGPFTGEYRARLAPHSAIMLRVTPVRAAGTR